MALTNTVSKKRVFVLGSGFSASMGLPILINLFKEVMEFPEREGESDKAKINTALQFLYPHFDVDISPPSYPPFEEFLSLVIAAEDFPFIWEGICASWRKSAVRMLTDFIATKSEKAEESYLLLEFTDNLQNGDVIITFNWDPLIERAMLAQSKKVNFKSRDREAISVLKLHGSINWVEVPEGKSIEHPETVQKLFDNIIYTPDYKYYDVWDPLDIPPLIVPPGFSKRVIVNNLFKEIWNEAFQALQNADSVAFIGYSIPRDDVQARSLLSIGWYSRSRTVENHKKHIKYILIDPNPEICGRYASIISGDFIYYQTYFDEKVLPILFS